MKTTSHAKTSSSNKKAPPVQKKAAKPAVKASAKKAPIAKAAAKPLKRDADRRASDEDYTGTEVNDREPKHLYRGAHTEATGLPFEDLPRHLGVDTDDENELSAGYARVGAGDRGLDSDEEDLEADESRGIEDAGV